jgi:hypothetical protein
MVPEVTRVLPFTNSYATTVGKMATRGTHQRSSGTYSSEDYMPRTIINGEMVEIPKPHLEMMEDWYSLNPRKGYCFRPFRYLPFTTGGDAGRMLGRMYHPDWGVWFDAVVPVNKWQALQYKSDWTMVPQAVDYRNHGLSGDKVCFVGRPQWFSWYDGTIDVDDDLLDKDRIKIDRKLSDSFLSAQVNSEEPELVPGPHGDITKEAFERLTSTGCVMCQAPIFEDDHDTITWVGEMCNQPLCYGCLDYATEGGLIDLKN